MAGGYSLFLTPRLAACLGAFAAFSVALALGTAPQKKARRAKAVLVPTSDAEKGPRGRWATVRVASAAIRA